MNDIHEFLTVLVPFADLPTAAEAFVTSLAESEGKRMIPIRVTLGDMVIERQADLKLNHVRAYPGFEIMSIEWGPHDGGPYPIFKGTLSVEDVGPTFSRLDLDGSYEPPLGLAGAVFDAVLGHRIAVAGARAIMMDIKNGFETAYREKGAAP